MEHTKLLPFDIEYWDDCDSFAIVSPQKAEIANPDQSLVIVSGVRTRELAEFIIRACNSYDKDQERIKALLDACKRDADLANTAILLTPTGEDRNRLTEINILRLEAITKAEGK